MKIMLFFITVLLVLITPINAQEDPCPDPTPPAEVLASAIAACGDLEPNEICYGHDLVELVTDCEAAENFNTPGARANVEAVCVVRTSGAGITLMRLQPEDAAVFVAMVGNVEMQSVSSGDVGLETIVAEDTNVYSGPGSDFEIIGAFEAGAEIYVNACNCTHNWLRVLQADGSVGWIPARRVNPVEAELPEVSAAAPVYEKMQAVTLATGADDACNGLRSGILVQMDDEPVVLQVNGVTVELESTAFIHASTGEHMEIDILTGESRITADTMTLHAPAGSHVLVPLSEQNLPNGEMVVELYSPDHVADLPLALLPRSVDALTVLDEPQPTIVGVEECRVISDTGEMACPVQFINPDGDTITRMDVEFIYAPQGNWEGSVHQNPPLLTGNWDAGSLAWNITCSLAGENFIGPVEWLITLEDESGNRSEPFKAAFNCVDG
ncbi:MAG: SH3 domain-containing protein [Chloroflexota bacterium]